MPFPAFSVSCVEVAYLYAAGCSIREQLRDVTEELTRPAPRVDDKTASEYALEGGATLHLVLALRGGADLDRHLRTPRSLHKHE